jgi:L-glyceraldehyde reductase
MEIAQAINISPTQLALSWAVQRGTSVIPKSSNLERLRTNLESMCTQAVNLNI